MRGVTIIKYKEEILKNLNEKLSALLDNENNWMANMANAASLLYHNLEDVNWAGFYLLQDQELVLGPFQGLPACVRIKVGNGVCGQAVKHNKIFLVNDVSQFEGHIACDPTSSSEIVIPLRLDTHKIIGVMDIDSCRKNRFSDLDKKYLKKFAKILIDKSEINNSYCISFFNKI